MKPPEGGDSRGRAAHARAFVSGREDFPWGERVVKVRGKVFLFLGRGRPLSLSVKLPGSARGSGGRAAAHPGRHGFCEFVCQGP